MANSETVRVYFLRPPHNDGPVVLAAEATPGYLTIRGPGIDGEDHDFYGLRFLSPEGVNMFRTDDGHLFWKDETGVWKVYLDMLVATRTEITL